VANKSPGDTAVLELFDRDLTSEGTVGLVEDVLRSNFNALAEVLACEEEVEGWRCDDDLFLSVSNLLLPLYGGCFGALVLVERGCNIPVLGSS